MILGVVRELGGRVATERSLVMRSAEQRWPLDQTGPVSNARASEKIVGEGDRMGAGRARCREHPHDGGFITRRSAPPK
jgi:hypothetical protein